MLRATDLLTTTSHPVVTSNVETPFSKLNLEAPEENKDLKAVINDPDLQLSDIKDSSLAEDFTGFESLPSLQESGSFVETTSREVIGCLHIDCSRKEKEDKQKGFSSSNLDDNILLDSEWELYSKQVNSTWIFAKTCRNNSVKMLVTPKN